jgi:hypothetical protein
MPVLAVPGAGLVFLGVMVAVFPAIFIFIISTVLILLGAGLLFLAFRMRAINPLGTDEPTVIKKTRIRVVESDETW